MATAEEPILSRIERLDNMLRQLEEIRGCNRSSKSSCASTPTSASDGRISSLDFSPKSLEKHCRPIENVIMEAEAKGTLIQRLSHVEDRVLKLEDEWEAERKMEQEKKMKQPKKKKGFKQLMQQCLNVRGKHDKKQEGSI
ncbi:uncharacterized protein LOC107612483 isoform X2 [Arachis ipaensis]|uniref:uncharacterized protein LOC107612483 isoform X2 n=1 Tax=Arachis ipaensis TaxID=130454 RepID=UPI0007AF271F|nr:uncharacterized protein LOC107612483 isoform X2 [Arachis ipaensis]XP_025673532.1 uncharacterized protein LOC112772745 isoform X2 [Arachis hypogaea]QHN97672.1 uncharacterized protein DS421_18g629360 [Arachis hypogaea]